MTDNAGNVWYPVIENKIERGKSPPLAGILLYVSFTWIELVYLQSGAQALARPHISRGISVFTVDRFRIEYLIIIYMTIVIVDCIDGNIAAGSFFHRLYTPDIAVYHGSIHLNSRVRSHKSVREFWHHW